MYFECKRLHMLPQAQDSRTSQRGAPKKPGWLFYYCRVPAHCGQKKTYSNFKTGVIVMRSYIARNIPGLVTIKIRTSAIMIVSILGIGLLSQAAYADVSQATIRGNVTVNGQIAQEGTQVTAENVDNGYSKSVVIADDGSYVLHGLAPGRYQIVVNADGNEQRSEAITLRVGQTAQLDLEARESVSGAVIEEIVVLGVAVARIDSSEMGTYITPEQIDRVPQVTRNFLSFADQAPGVTVDYNQNDGSINLRSGAQGSSAVNVFIDGVSQKDYVLRGGISGQDSSRGNPFPQSAIAEYKVITSNYKAEFDQVSSAAITAVTRSGSNEFHGGVFYDFADSGMREKTPIEKQSGVKADDQQEQYGLWLSGPIINDKLHYFVSYESKDNEDLRNVTPNPSEQYIQYFPQFLQDAIVDNTRSVTAPFEEDLFFGKLSWEVDDKQFLEFTIKYRDETELTGFGGQNTPEYGTAKDNSETRIAIKHQFNSYDFFNNLIVTYEDSEFNPRAANAEPGARYTFATGPFSENGIINLGGGPDYQVKGQDGWSIQDDFTFTGWEWHGAHTLKAGVKFKQITLSAIEQNPRNPQFFYSLDVTSIVPTTTTLDAVPYKLEWGAPLNGIGDGAAKSDGRQFGFYVQDDWDVSDRMTLFLGVRWDYEVSPIYEDYRTPQDVRDALGSWNNVQIAEYNINDYISTGTERESPKDAWQPRLGFSYAISDEGNHILVGGYGRSYNRNQFDFLQLETTKGTFPRFQVNFDGDHQFGCNDPCIPWDPSYLTPGGLDSLTGNTGAREVYLLNNDLKTPFSDQYSVALRSSWSVWETEVGYTHIDSQDGFLFLLGNRRADGNFFAPGDSWGAPWGDAIPGPDLSNLILGTNGLETKSDAFHIKVDKPQYDDDKWGLAITYTYTDAEENRQFNEVFSFDYPSVQGYGWHDAGGVSDHSLVASFTYDLPWDINFGSKLRLRSAAPFYGLSCIPGWNACEYVSGYQDESGLGEMWAFTQLDLSVSKSFAVRDSGSFIVRFDVLNATNETNYAGFDTWYGGAGESPNPNFGNPNGGIGGPMRTAKLSVAYNW